VKSTYSVICLGPRKWLARYGEMVCGPLSLPRAKAAAMAMAKGAPGDYYLTNLIAHLKLRSEEEARATTDFAKAMQPARRFNDGRQVVTVGSFRPHR
jgi:hypothetical protein